MAIDWILVFLGDYSPSEIGFHNFPNCFLGYEVAKDVIQALQ